MVMSAITAADDAFAVLAARPAPLAFDARGIPGLPPRHLDLTELRDLITRSTGSSPVLPAPSVDLVWRRLAEQARSWGPAWVVAAVGLATPALTLLARRLTAGRPELIEDVDSEVVAGFLEAVRTHDLDAPRLWLRMLWAAWRAGNRVRPVREAADLPDELAVASSTPRMPYGHPDLLLGRAVAAGVLTGYEAALIGDTRLGDTLIETLAAEQGVSAPVLRMRRHRAERALVTALPSLTDLALAASPRHAPETRTRHDRRPRGTTAAGQPHQHDDRRVAGDAMAWAEQLGPEQVLPCQPVSGRVRNPRVRTA